MRQDEPKRVGVRRPRILWIVLAAMLFVSLVPLILLQRRVLSLSVGTVIDNERLQQTEVTRLVAAEVLLYESGLRQQLLGQRQVLQLSGLIREWREEHRADRAEIRARLTRVEERVGLSPK